ncbi:MFS transporter [Actinoplanes aureus]|uniref:MFS transporter n=1 Tax=Actinoplanes aureus TaxID=2792083 RepID=A0A931C858_9ACTN|nr:MFS transporter [Actinoplanes aureus]MBG0565190.1 MFS transporter [Actinoplanes aureus]
MPLLPTLGRTVGTGVRAARLLVRSSVRGSAWATRRVGSARARGAANEIGMIRLFDLHAISCAGDALIAIGLAGTIFSVPLGEARSKVALYLLITMVPFALLAPVVGPLLDHFRHGRRYALATTMLGRAFLAYVMADNLLGWGLYPAAFGVLAFSRAYGVARSAAVPRLLPEGVGLSQVGARASVYGTFAGALLAPIGLLAFKFGPQWPLRVAAIIFMVGVVISLRLPPRADSDPPEAMPRPWRAVLRLGRGTERPLAGRLVLATLIGSASLRLLYGFLLLFLTFAIMGDDLNTTALGTELSRGAAVGVVGAALALGTFISTAAGTGLTIRRPLALQSSGLVVTAGVAVLATVFYNLAMLTLLALLTAVFSGIAKLAVDASIQERVPEKQRATAFAHSETVLMLAWVGGGGIGLIPLTGRLGVGLAAVLAVLAAGRAAWAAARLHNERLAGRPDGEVRPDDAPAKTKRRRTAPADAKVTDPGASPRRTANSEDWLDERPDAWPESEFAAGAPADPWPEAPTVPGPGNTAAPAQRGPRPARGHATEPGRTAEKGATGRTGTNPQRATTDADGLDPTLVEPPAGRKWWQGRRKDKAAGSRPKTEDPIRPAGIDPAEGGDRTERTDRPEPPVAPPGYHVYRPSSAGSGTRNGDPGHGEES